MAKIGEISTATSQSKPVVVRVKRKAHQSRLDFFWLEINERPTKRATLDLEKLSITNSVDVKVEELKAKKVFVKHFETVTSTDTTMEIVQSFASNSADVVEEQKRTIKNTNKSRFCQDPDKIKRYWHQTLVLGKFGGAKGETKRHQKIKHCMTHDMCHFYDVIHVEESFNEVQEHEGTSLEDQKILSSYLPLLRDFLPSAAAEVESDIHAYLSNQAVDDYVYDYYTVKDDADIDDIDCTSPFPLVKVEDEDFYDGLDDESEYDTDDSNAEDHPRNDYPDESSIEDDESESEVSLDESEGVDEGDASSIKQFRI